MIDASIKSLTDLSKSLINDIDHTLGEDYSRDMINIKESLEPNELIPYIKGEAFEEVEHITSQSLLPIKVSRSVVLMSYL